MKEVWKDIKDYEGLYEVSNFGRIKSLARKEIFESKNQYRKFKSVRKISEKIINQTINAKGYYQIVLYKNGKKKNMLVHRIIAEAFIPNPLNKLTINHIDGNRANNNINNLEWATYKEQQIHRIYKLGHKSIITDKCRKEQIKKHERAVIREDGKIYQSIKIASEGNETLRKNINECCKGKRKIAGGYSWKYL